MIEILIKPVIDLLIKNGDQALNKSKEFQHSKKAIRSAIQRELKFLECLIFEVLHDKKSKAEGFEKAIADEMDFSIFTSLEHSSIPIELYFDKKQIKPKKDSNGQFLNWSRDTITEEEWIAKIYLRARILRARWRSGKSQSKKSVEYVQWLIKQWRNSYFENKN